MKKTILLLAILSTVSIKAQSTYETGMTEAFNLWKANKTTEAVQLFERIATVETDNWLPSFYVATIEITTSFGLKDEQKLNAKLKKAQQFLDRAKSLSENNAEILITQALLNTAYIAFDGQKYGMTLSPKNNMLYKKALQLAPENPRVVLSKAEWGMGSARFFGQSIAPYCNDVKKALQLFESDEPKKFHPSHGKERALQLLKNCEKKQD